MPVGSIFLCSEVHCIAQLDDGLDRIFDYCAPICFDVRSLICFLIGVVAIRLSVLLQCQFQLLNVCLFVRVTVCIFVCLWKICGSMFVCGNFVCSAIV